MVWKVESDYCLEEIAYRAFDGDPFFGQDENIVEYTLRSELAFVEEVLEEGGDSPGFLLNETGEVGYPVTGQFDKLHSAREYTVNIGRTENDAPLSFTIFTIVG